MCGIAGILNWTQALHPEKDKELLRRMTDTLIHRGPDDGGVFLSGPVGLGFRRLSIIDVAGGHQPMCNEDETVWIVFNGEIYNHPELMKNLQARGHRYRSRCDTETLVHLYEEYGERFLDHVEGMFAFALWDSKEKKLILARDRMGEKPLYYAPQPWGLVFGSEPKALLTHPAVSRSIDRDALEQYFAFQYIPAPHSIHKGMKKLRAGEMLVCRQGEIRKSLYWDLPQKSLFSLPSQELEEELLRLLDASVKLRLISDVPLGVFLSAGIDSSAVTALAARHTDRLKTFSIGFRESSYDESKEAREIARRFGTDHHEQTLEAKDSLDLVPAIGQWLDEPLADSSLIPTYLLSRFTRQHVKVALGGDGGDELFGGYPTYPAHHWHRLTQKFPKVWTSALKGVLNHWPVSHSYMSWGFKAEKYLAGADLPMPERHLRWMSNWQPEELKRLLTHSRNGGMEAPSIPSGFESRDDSQQAMALDCKTFLPEDVLVKVDRSSMANSLEVRAPFLDRAVVEFALRLPPESLSNRLKTKILLRRALKGTLPESVRNRPKHGFAVPVGEWLKGPLKPLLNDMLSTERLKSSGLFQWNFVEGLKESHLSGKADHARRLWSLLIFELWRENAEKKEPVTHHE